MTRLLPLALLLLACGSPQPYHAVASGPAGDEVTSTAARQAPPPVGAVQLSPVSCPAAAAHVYNPGRLWLLNGCRETLVRGLIRKISGEADGDEHVRLRVDATEIDSRMGNYTNAENRRQQGGDLVLEPVCEKSVSQPDAVAACAGYHNPLQVPAVGSHVAVTGWWVLDAAHGWTELHPVTAIQVIT